MPTSSTCDHATPPSMRLLGLLGLCTTLACATADSPSGTMNPSLAGADATQASEPTGGHLVDATMVRTAATARDVARVKVRLDAEGRTLKVAVYHGDAEAIPAAVRDLASRKFPGAQPVAYETERYADLGEVFEVEVEMDGRKCEIAATASGEEIYTECRIAEAELPAPVRDKLTGLYPEGRIVEAEHKKSARADLPDVYTIEVQHGGREYYVHLEADGNLRAHLVRVPGVIEIPVQ